MSRAAGPYNIIEKINDNAYKFELPPEFGVSPTFNIVDLKPYLGEEDELESRMTQIKEGEDDEDITPSDVPTDPPTIMQGPMTRARMRQLNLEVSSFLSDLFHTFEDDDQQGRPTQAGGPVQHEFESASASWISLP